MTELIKGLVQVRDGLSLIAFLSLVLLLAFRTRKVPELFFGLVRDKLTREHFSQLLHRFMTLGFISFLVLVSLAVLAQVLNHLTAPHALTIDDLRSELAKAKNSEDEKLHAEAQYKLAMEKLAQHDVDSAITSLKESIKAIPTLTAQEMLTYLYHQKRDFDNESATWERAVKTARQQGSTLAMARLDNVSVPHAIAEAEGEHDLIGKSTQLPTGGDRYETAVEITPGLYTCGRQPPNGEGFCDSWYKLYLQTGQSLDVKFRSPPLGGLAGISIYGTNGEMVAQQGDGPSTMRGNAGPRATLYEKDWIAPAKGWYFIVPHADSGTIYRIAIH